jgi:general nucleoside transport system permease protein
LAANKLAWGSLRPFGWGAGAFAAGLLPLALGLAIAGYDVPLALGALWRGAFGSWDAFLSATVVRAIPLIIVGLGVSVAFRAGAWNIGAEGQFYAGAIAASWIGVKLTGWSPLAAIGAVWLLAGIGGVLWISVPVLLRLRFGTLEVISTLLFNFIAEAAVSYAVNGPLQEPSHVYPQSEMIAAPARLFSFPGSRLHLGIFLALALALLLWVLFTRTVWGFRLRAVGLGPRAAEVTGRINSRRVVGSALLCSGALAGLAGGIEVTGVTYRLYQNLSPGYGFTAIAVALLARLDPLAVIATGVLFGALEAGAQGMQREAGVPAVTVAVAEAAVILAILLADAIGRSPGRYGSVVGRAARLVAGWTRGKT